MQQTITTNPEPENPKRKVWGIVLKVIATVVATLLGALGLQSCM
ncbi:smalltalk protein [Parabacteroides sp. AF18-52]|nr:smalltalk protein [Parabacteroides sp. AF18-52]